MKLGLKFLIVSSVIGLSGCAVVKGVLQAGYDHRTESECDKSYTDPESIHLPANCRAITEGTYTSKLEKKKSDKKKDENEWD